MLITINGLPGVGKSSACKRLVQEETRLTWRGADLKAVVGRLVNAGVDARRPEGFVEWQRALLEAVILEATRRPPGICLFECGVEQVAGYSGAIPELRSRDDNSWRHAQNILSAELARVTEFIGSPTVVLTAGISAIRERRVSRAQEPDYTGLRDREADLQLAFVRAVRGFSQDVEVIDTTERSVEDVARCIGGLINRQM